MTICVTICVTEQIYKFSSFGFVISFTIFHNSFSSFACSTLVLLYLMVSLLTRLLILFLSFLYLMCWMAFSLGSSFDKLALTWSLSLMSLPEHHIRANLFLECKVRKINLNFRFSEIRNKKIYRVKPALARKLNYFPGLQFCICLITFLILFLFDRCRCSMT